MTSTPINRTSTVEHQTNKMSNEQHSNPAAMPAITLTTPNNESRPVIYFKPEVPPHHSFIARPASGTSKTTPDAEDLAAVTSASVPKQAKTCNITFISLPKMYPKVKMTINCKVHGLYNFRIEKKWVGVHETCGFCHGQLKYKEGTICTLTSHNVGVGGFSATLNCRVHGGKRVKKGDEDAWRRSMEEEGCRECGGAIRFQKAGLGAAGT
jgi:hypothetical protein